MTDLTKLKELAERATPGPWSAVWEEGDDTAWPNLFPIIQADGGETVIGNEGFYSDLEQDKANAKFIAAANPQAILGLLERLEKAEQHWANENSNNMALIAEVERLRTRLEIDDRTPYDGIACRDETIKGLDEKCDRLKAENEALREIISECATACGAGCHQECSLEFMAMLPDEIASVVGKRARNAAIGAVVWQFIDRMTDVCEQDPAERILEQFVAAVRPAIDAALEGGGR